MKKLFTHVKRWNRWRKHCLNGKLHKALVLLGVIKSPTMPFILLPQEIEGKKHKMMTGGSSCWEK